MSRSGEVKATFTAETPAQAASTVAGNGIAITASPAVAGSTNAGAAAGGTITLTAGAAAQKTSGSAAGGDILGVLGAGVGGGRTGLFQLGGTTSSYPAISIVSAPAMTFVLADNSARCAINAVSADLNAGTARTLTFSGNGGGPCVGTGGQYSLSDNTNGAIGTVDGGLARAAATVAKITNGSTGYGSIRAEWPRRRFGSHKTPGTAATLTAEGGCPTHTLTGSASNLSNSSGHYVLLSGDAAIAGVDIATTEVLKTEINPIATFVIRTGTTLPTDATERLWVGFSSASLSATDSPTGAHVMAFRYAIDSDGTAFWRCVTNDGGADTGTVTVSTIAIAAATRYRLTIDSTDPASIKFFVNGALAATHATNLPTTTTAMGTQCFALDAGAGVMELAISKIGIETD